MERDVAAVLGYSWTYACIQKFLNLVDDLSVFASVFCMAARWGLIAIDDWLSGLVVLHNSTQNSGLYVVPLSVVRFCHGDKVNSEEHTSYTLYSVDTRRQGRFFS